MRSLSGRDRIEQVRRPDEQHLREVVGEIEVMVGEAVVLLRVEHLEQRRGRIAAEVGPELVDLVEHHDGVHRPRLHRLDDPAGQRAHVRAPVPADLGLVAHAAEGEPHELAADGPRDGLAEGGLADAGGPMAG